MFSKKDKTQVDNLIKIISRAEMKLQGVEVLAAADAMKWLSEMQVVIEKSLLTPPPVKKEKIKKDV